MKKLQIYFGCALAYGPLPYQAEIASLKKELSQIPWIQMLEFCVPLQGQQQSELDPADIYKNDIIDCVGVAHVVLGDLTYPSTGLGAELMAGMKVYKVRTMMFARETTNNENGEEKKTIVSRLWIGAPAHNANASFTWYTGSIIDLFSGIIEELKKVHSELQLQEIVDM